MHNNRNGNVLFVVEIAFTRDLVVQQPIKHVIIVKRRVIFVLNVRVQEGRSIIVRDSRLSARPRDMWIGTKVTKYSKHSDTRLTKQSEWS